MNTKINYGQIGELTEALQEATAIELASARASAAPGQYWRHEHAGRVRLVRLWHKTEWVVEDEAGRRSLRFIELMKPDHSPNIPHQPTRLAGPAEKQKT